MSECYTLAIYISGILKRRGTGSGSAMSRSTSAPNIVSLKQKSQEPARRKDQKRISFGHDEIRYMEPSSGIKSRLGFGRCSSPPAPELDGIDEPGLQTELKKIAVGKDKFELKRVMKIVNESNKALRMSVTPERSVGDDSQEFYVKSRNSESKDSSLRINIKNNEYRKSQDTEYRVDKVDLALRAAKLKSNLDQRREESASSKPLTTTSSRKRLVKIDTLDDGSKVRSYIEPDDPILEAVPVKRSKQDTGDKKIQISAGHVVTNFTVDRSSGSGSGSGAHSHSGHRTLAQKAEFARSKQEIRGAEARSRSEERSRSRYEGGEARSGQVKSSPSVHHRIGSSRERETEGHRDRMSQGSVRDRMGSRDNRTSSGSIRDRLGGKEETSRHEEKNIYSRLGGRERD